MLWRYAYHALLVFTVWIIQTGLISAAPGILASLNLGLVSLLLLLLFDDLDLLFFWGLGLGWLFSLSSSLPFGLLLIAWWLLAGLAYLVINKFLTNRSLYSLIIITLASTIFLELFITLGLRFLAFMGGKKLFLNFTGSYFFDLFESAMLNAGAMLLAFYLLTSLNNKLKPFLILKRQHK
jgi:hypothetical protein